MYKQWFDRPLNINEKARQKKIGPQWSILKVKAVILNDYEIESEGYMFGLIEYARTPYMVDSSQDDLFSVDT